MARDTTLAAYGEDGNLDAALNPLSDAQFARNLHAELNPLSEAQFAGSPNGVQRGATRYRSDSDGRSPSDPTDNVSENPGYGASSPDNPGFGMSPTTSGSNIGAAGRTLSAELDGTPPMNRQKTMKNFV